MGREVKQKRTPKRPSWLLIIYSYRNHKALKWQKCRFADSFQDIQCGYFFRENCSCVKRVNTSPQTTRITTGENIGGEFNRNHCRNVKESQEELTKWKRI